ncbi:MAG: NAD(P)-dependent oxidoreductase [Trueperaceae bacterium]|nr:NAD(P)-dependent oxidoreductase [Trueperaceae bacterium]MCC6309747.1 NAD(P)-dependent oxidoreductase [Trueperaceae bacterium]MCO5173903.1 NAD(P)-dependent oxidoreductase [Trueperaceae bacterium]MCW5820651.1 NAD(P)-dependent oxidoreductase [Trueperaceae bacterium]
MSDTRDRLGFIGTGNMGFPMAARLLKAGFDVAVYNRTRSKAEPLTEYGATVVDRVAELADRDIVFTMVADPATLLTVTTGPDGVLSVPGKAPRILIDSSTVDTETSAKVRAKASTVGTELLAAPVSGNGKVVKAGRLSVAVSGDRSAFERALPYLEALGEGVTYVGTGELARTVKIAHNVLLGVVTQALAEITVLAEKGGIERRAFLDFINNSVMGSVFTKYKTPALVNLDFKPTFTPPLLRKDLDLGLAAGRELNVPMPVTAATREAVQALIGRGHTADDFATLLLLTAEGAGLQLAPDPAPVDDGLRQVKPA